MVLVVVVAPVESGGADAFELSVVAVMTPAMANRAVVNFFADMTCSLGGVSVVVTDGNSIRLNAELQDLINHQ